MSDTEKKHVVILGSGFGGIRAYLKLHQLFHKSGAIEVTIVSKSDHFLFVPLVHEVASGNLMPSSVRQSVRTVPQCCLSNFVPATAREVDLKNQTVTYTHAAAAERQDGVASEGTISYDYLIMAIGSVTDYLGVPGARKHTLALKTLEDAVRIKNTILNRFEEAQLLPDEGDKRRKLTFIIVGGGPTGVQMAGELSDLLNKELARAYPSLSRLTRIIVLESGDRLVKEMDPWFSRRIEKILCKKGKVDVHLNTRVQEVEPVGVKTKDGFFEGETIIWTAGVRARELAIEPADAVSTDEETGRIRVTPQLNLASHENVFVVGDQAWICDRENDQPYPMRAQFAVREGKRAAKNVYQHMNGGELRDFKFRDKGVIISVGKGGALAKLLGIQFSGPVAWLIYRFAYLFNMLGVRTKIRTFVEWSLNLFSPRDISEL